MAKKTDKDVTPEKGVENGAQDAAGKAFSDSWQDALQDGPADQGDIDLGVAVGEGESNDAGDKAEIDESNPVAMLIAERDQLKDQLLRALAETENMRRRTERETASSRKYGHTSFARDLVGAIDNLARALQVAAPQNEDEKNTEHNSANNSSVDALLTGIELSWNEIQSVVEKHGIKQVNPVGERFDYNLHQAMFEVPTNEVEPGMVVEVIQHGYVLHDRLLRPAMVGVSKALPAEDG